MLCFYLQTAISKQRQKNIKKVRTLSGIMPINLLRVLNHWVLKAALPFH